MTPLRLGQILLGVHETSANAGPVVDTITGGRHEPWCAHFVAFLFRETGTPLPGDVVPSPKVAAPLAGVAHMEATFKAQGWWTAAGTVPAPGDVVFFASRGGSDAGPGRHVGIVERVQGPVFWSIDGNWGNKVARVKRALANPQITGYGRVGGFGP